MRQEGVEIAAALQGVEHHRLPKGFRVLCIAPGVFETPFMDVLSDAARSTVADAVPLPPQLGRLEEYASLMIEVCRNRMLNGETIRLDGALLLRGR